jgi:hypothetical protein
MKLSQEAVSEFCELLEKEYGEPVSLAEGEKSANKLLNLFVYFLKK